MLPAGLASDSQTQSDRHQSLPENKTRKKELLQQYHVTYKNKRRENNREAPFCSFERLTAVRIKHLKTHRT